MVKKKTQARQKTSFAPRSGRSHPLLAVVLLTLAVMVFVALLDYDPMQSPEVTSEVAEAAGPEAQNLVGKFGAFIGFWSFYWLGLASWLVPVFVLWVSYLLSSKRAQHVRWLKLGAMVLAILACAGLGNMLQQHVLDDQLSRAAAEPLSQRNSEHPFYYYPHGHGGLLGKVLYQDSMNAAVGPFGSFLVYLLASVAGFTLAFTNDPAKHWEELKAGFLKWWASCREGRKVRAARRAEERQQRRQQREEAKARREEERKREKAERAARKESDKQQEAEKAAQAKDEKEASGGREVDEEDLAADPAARKVASASKTAGKKSLGKMLLDDDEDDEDEKPDPEPDKKPATPSNGKKKASASEEKPPAPEEPEQPATKAASEASSSSKETSGLKIIAGETVEKASGHLPERKGEYVFPSLDLLQEPPEESGPSEEDYEETAQALVRTLSQFKVDVNLGEVHSGPVITRYEVVPAPGVRVNKIESLDKDLALGLKAQSVRILAPVPGKGTVGIEVPNKEPAPVALRDIIESKAWADSKSEIPIVLGKEVTGRPVVIDLTKMPHMLIAGSTGSGKTVCINAVISSLLYKMSPEDLRFIMVDPKVVEMQSYNALPHMLIPVVTEPKKVPAALKWLIKEMERRYQIFSQMGVRNIAGFNAKIIKSKEAREKAEQMDAELSPEERNALTEVENAEQGDGIKVPKEKLPYIVCIIDELADLMMVAPADIETCVARLAQLARAAGIHLVLATQRPSTNVITGVIKANLPTRIAFKVSSNTDSRVILDSKGAEALIGKGDMLFVPPGTSVLTRAQGAFVSDEELTGIVEYLKQNGPPDYADDVQAQIDAAGDEDGGGSTPEGDWEDELVPQAIDVIRTSKRASTSMLQRRLKIGYNRAARLMESLEDEGIVGPENGSSPREILIDPDSP